MKLSFIPTPTKLTAQSSSRTAIPSVASIAALLLLLALSHAISPVSAKAAKWLTEPEFRVRLRQPAGYAWSQKPLRDVLTALGEHHGIAILLDRRIDPSQTVPGSSTDVLLEHLLQGLANHLEIGVSFLGPVVYFGPKDATEKLATLSELRKDDAKEMERSRRNPLLQPRQSEWEMLAEPRQLMLDIAADAGLRVRNPEAVEHDLWPRTALPALSAIDRLLLVLAGFDLAFEFADNGEIKLVPTPTVVTLVRTYTVPRGAVVSESSLRRKFPEAEFQLRGQTAIASTSAETHRQLKDYFAGRTIRRPGSVTTTTGQPKIAQLNVQNKSVETVVNYLASQLKFEVEFKEVPMAKRQQLVSFTVKDATVDEVLRQTLEPAMLRFARENGKVVISQMP